METKSFRTLLPVLAALLCSLTMSAETIGGECGETGDSLTWSLNTDLGVLTISGTGTRLDPCDDEGHAPWYDYRSKIRYVDIAANVEYIGTKSFMGLDKLDSLYVPSSLKAIGDSAFANCSNLKRIDLPEGLETIGEYAFQRCTSLQSIIIPASVTSIGFYAFNMCFSNGYVWSKIENPFGQIAFDSRCITALFVPQGTRDAYIAAGWAFKGGVMETDGQCGNLLYWSFNPETGKLTLTGRGEMFSYSSASLVPWAGCMPYIKSVEIPEGVTNIGSCVFFGCDALRSVSMPSSVTTIGERAFYNCEVLSQINLPSGLTRIGDRAFQNCSRLSSITLPANVEEVGELAFFNCTGLTAPVYNSHVFAYLPILTSGAYAIPEVETIAPYAFFRCSNLTSVIIPSTVGEIGEGAFENCSSLESVTAEMNPAIPFGTNAFYGISSSCLLRVANDVKDDYIAKGWTTDVFKGGIVAPNPSGTCGDGLRWELDMLTGELRIMGTGAMTNYPSQSVMPWNDYKNSIKSVSISDGVTSIGTYAFYGCNQMESVSIPGSVKTIGDRAFYLCSKLKETIIPEGVTTLGVNVFRLCTSLERVVIPSTATNFSAFIFEGCTSLTDVTLPSNMQSIFHNMFYGCTALTSISLPASLKIIGVGTFRGSGLTSISLPSGMSSISDNAFNGCSSLTSVTATMQTPFSFGTDAFSGIADNCVLNVPAGTRDAYIAKGWTTDVFKGGVVEMPGGTCGDNLVWNMDTVSGELIITGTGAMYNYSSQTLPWKDYGNHIQKVTIGSGATSLGDWAFFSCQNLRSVSIPESVTSIGNQVFRNCTALASAELPSGLTTIGNYVFYECTGLASVTLPAGLTSMGNSVFYHCSSLTGKIELPSSLTTLPQGTFSGCSGLTDIDIPESVTSIGYSAFYGCSGLTSIELPQSLTALESTLFTNCTNLKDINIPAGVTSIGSNVFEGCTSMEQITLPEGLTSISSALFWKCSALEEVNIPSSVTSIQARAFEGCTSLTTIEIPEGVTSIGAQAFRNCSSLRSVTSEIESPAAFGNYAFQGIADNCVLHVPMGTRQAYLDKGWDETVFKGGVIDDGGAVIDGIYYTFDMANRTAFVTQKPEMNYEGLVVIPDSIEVGNSSFQVVIIKEKAFYGCDKITGVVLPYNLQMIEPYAFQGCSKLRVIVSAMPNYDGLDDTAFTALDGKQIAFYQEYDTDVTFPEYFENHVSYFLESYTDRVEIDGLNYLLDIRNSTATIIPDSYSGHVTVPASVSYRGHTYTTSISSFSFYGCTELSSVTLPETLQGVIGYSAFSGCTGLTSIVIPEGVQSISENAFALCPALTAVIVEDSTPCPIDENAFPNRANATLYVPVGSKAAYLAADYWKEFMRIIEIVDGDANGDGSVSITDVGLIIDYILGKKPAGFILKAADVNKDDAVTITDVGLIIDAILSQGSAGVKERRTMHDMLRTLERQPE